MFVNYFDDDTRSSPVNLAIARGIIGFWLIWKTAMYDWRIFVEAPVYLTPEFAWAVPPVAPGLVLTIEKWLLIGLLFAFIIGYRIRLSAGLGALLLAHLGTVRMTQITSGESESLFLGVYLLIFFALFADSDLISLDHLRRARAESPENLRERLVNPPDHYRHPPLKWGLVVIALVYFGSGFDKIFHGGVLQPSLEFAAADNLARIAHLHYPDSPVQFLAEIPLVMRAGGIATLILELGFLLAVVAGITITPFMIGLILFTLTNVMLLGIHFVDVYFLVLLFVAWDVGYQRIMTEQRATVVFDDRCPHCMRSITPLSLLDVRNCITFMPSSEVRVDEDLPTVNDHRLVVDIAGNTYQGEEAMRRLLELFGIISPIAWVLVRSVHGEPRKSLFEHLATPHSD